ncbi:ak8 [Symbiodinium natans]|uniref:Ak8 protein n=1 Tax=Symbiodinium natans TaxID=878477 RepID=A0A812NBJ3_9DINO|nr:ak8 [Symbiodinium natans]
MVTPVQTWGALGNMVPEQKEFGAETNAYLESYEVYDLFAHLLRQVLVERPENPIKFLQECLKEQSKLCVCVMGPPGVNRSKYCQQLATDYKVKHIHVGKLLRAKKELKDVMDSGELVSDDTVVDIVKEELRKAKHTGWVLDGFPRTKVQAQSLAAASKELGTSLDSVLLLDSSEDLARQNFAAKVDVPDPAVKREVAEMRLQQYKRHVLTISEFFKNSVRRIEINGGEDEQKSIYATISSNVQYRVYSNAPLRMQRVCILGPCGSGRTTQCQLLAKRLGVVHVDLAVLLREKQEAEGQEVDEVPPDYLSDEEACALIAARLRKTDCVRKGWVLDGFPKTRAQAEFLRQAHLWPSRVIQLQVADPVVETRVSSRRLDPVTGTAHYSNPNSVAVRQRLIRCKHDEGEKVKERINIFLDNVAQVSESWKRVFTTVLADGQPDDVAAGVYEKVSNPLPSELAQDPNSGL